MMIQKLRRLGLGLFPAEKDDNIEEMRGDFDSQRQGRNGFESVSYKSSRASQALEFFKARSKAGSYPSSAVTLGPGLVEAERRPSFSRKSRKSYGLQLFEAALRNDAQRREKEWEDIESQKAEKAAEPAPEPGSGSPEVYEAECKSSLNRLSQKLSYSLPTVEAESRNDVQRRRQGMEKVKCRTNFERALEDEVWVDEDSEELCTKPGERYFVDEDCIKLGQKSTAFRSVQRIVRGQCYLITMPKRIMIQMPKSPNSYVTPHSVPNFYIRVIMVHMSDPSSVDLAVDWLMGDGDKVKNCILGLKCELGTGRELNLIQLSLHRRCVLIRLLEVSTDVPQRLAKLLATHNVVKIGTDIEDDAVAIFWATGMVVNAFKNVSEVYVYRQRPLSMSAIFRKLYKWEWTYPPEIAKSDWARPELSSNQIKYGIMSAWSSRMISLDGPAAVERALTLMSLENLPRRVLDLFGRAISDAFRTEESSLHETSGTLSETSQPGNLQLLQHSFRSRVKGRCVVEMHLKEDQGLRQYKIKSRKGKAVILTPIQSTAKCAVSECITDGYGQLSIESIKGLTVVEGPKCQGSWQSKRLWDGLRSVIRNPAVCPKHLLLALGCNVASTQWTSACESGSEILQLTNIPDLGREPFLTISRHLNESQRAAWRNILTTPLSATIGPPGTGKTSLIQSVTKSWIAARGKQSSKEVLLCTAYQNVAVRHLAETLLEGEVPGILLLVSEDYYEFHESFYRQLLESVVVSCLDQCAFSVSLADWKTRNDGRSFPHVVVCTVDLIGGPSFVTSLMTGTVTALIIDESSQASDVSFLRPLISLPDLCMVSVLGDPYQLPPYSAVRSNGDVPSVFNLVSHSCMVNFLREQYRMPPSICEFLSAEVYDNILMTAPHRLKEKDTQPLVWSHVRGVAAIAPGKTSMYNLAEASAIVHFCRTLVRTMKVTCNRVVVLTLYEEQTRQISDDLAANELAIPVHNVDSFQGQQCDIVLISLVVGRSFSSFAADNRRACVMLSRVRRLLCIFGDFDEVKRNHQAGLWMRLANHCKKQNLVIDEDKVECFLASSVEEARGTWVPLQDKTQQLELLSNAETAASEMPFAGIAVQVVFRAQG